MMSSLEKDKPIDENSNLLNTSDFYTKEENEFEGGDGYNMKQV